MQNENHNNSGSQIHKVIVMNRGPKKLPPQIVVMDSKVKLKTCESFGDTFVSFSGEQSPNSSFSEEEENIIKVSPIVRKPVVRVKSNDSLILKFKNDACELNACLKNILEENQEIHCQLNATIQRNTLLEDALKQPAPFKKTHTGFRFPGKKEMEEKLKLMKDEIVKLNSQITELQTSRNKLNFVKAFFNEYNAISLNCDCKKTVCPKQNLDEVIRIKSEQIVQIKAQTKRKTEELNMLKTEFEKTVNANTATIEKTRESFLELSDLTSQIQEISESSEFGQGVNEDDLKKMLNQENNKIVSLEMIVKSRNNEISDCEDSTADVEKDIRDLQEIIDCEQNKLESTSENFNKLFDRLVDVYQTQIEDLTAIPVLLSVTYKKLQKITDMRVLAEDTCDKLQNEFNEEAKTVNLHESVAEEKNRGQQAEQEAKLLLTQLDAEKRALESKITFIRQKLSYATSALNDDLSAQEMASKEVMLTSDDSAKQINAMKKYSDDCLCRNINEVMCLKDLLAELRTRECEKSVMRKKVLDEIQQKTNMLDETFRKTITEVTCVQKAINEAPCILTMLD